MIIRKWWGRSSPPCGPLTASALGAIDGGAINQIKRVRSIWFHRGYRYFTILILMVFFSQRRHSKVRLSWSGVSAGSILTSHICTPHGLQQGRPIGLGCRTI